jgi:hypothetical protein
MNFYQKLGIAKGPEAAPNNFELSSFRVNFGKRDIFDLERVKRDRGSSDFFPGRPRVDPAFVENGGGMSRVIVHR